MERRKQIQELIRRFDRDFVDSIASMNNQDQLIVTLFLKTVIPIFIERADGYYDRFYALYEKEILERLRSKSKKMYNLKLTDYFVQDSMKLVELQHELKINVRSGDEQQLSDEEFTNFMQKATNIVNLQHQLLLIADDAQDSEKPAKRKQAPSPKVENNDDDSETNVEPTTNIQALGEREEYLTIEQCAKFLGRSKVTLHEYKKNGLPFYKIGRTIKFKKSEVLNFMRQQDRKKQKRK